MISPLVRRMRLARELRELRDAAGLTTEQVARGIGQSRMKISRLENAHGRPNVADVMKVLDVLGVEGERWHTLVQVASDAAERGWWEAYGTDMGARQQIYADLESGAATIQEYQFFVPGLLQTGDFTRARLAWSRARGLLPATHDITRSVEARAARQRMLTRPGGPTYEVILEEIAVRRLAAPPDVMRVQLRHLADVVRVLPVDASIADYWLPRSPFSLYTYADPGDPMVAVVDTETTDLVLTEPDAVAPYAELYDRLRAAALSPQDSLTFIAEAADNLS